MPSASKGRYQSRLFNFFHQQSRRFGEGFGHSLRQLQVATSWSLEALAKTVYLLVEKAVDSAGRQLPAAETQTSLQLEAAKPADSAETPILRVIENVQSTTKNNKFTPSGCSAEQIQGIASQLYSHNLVLVTNENQILDVLTPSQQQALENKIITEIADYWRSWRLSQENKDTKLLSRVEGLLQRFSATNKTAKKALPPESTRERESRHLQINPSTLASLDTAIAKLETNALTPVSRAQIILRQRSSELIKVVKNKLDIFLYGDRQSITNKQVVADGNLETQKSTIQTLISAALNYFYGETDTKKIKQNTPRRYLSGSKSLTAQLKNEQSKDDWLTLDDLIGSEYPQFNQENQTLNNSSEKLFGRFQLPNWRTLQLKEKAGLPKSQKSIAQVSPTSQKMTIAAASGLQNRNKGEITQTQKPESTQIEAKPEWIETKAEIVGYQKHPLEQLLVWIDSAMLKIEEVFVKIAKALGQLWQQ